MVAASKVRQLFKDRFQSEPRLFRAPGRVNLIGEHTDYNDGFVMPLAIDRDTVTAATSRDDRVLRVYSDNLNEEATVDLSKPLASVVGSWTSYIEGMARVLMAKGHDIGGADLLILSDVPEGAGLSSSAALELSVGTALKALNRLEIDPIELALAAQHAEHEYAGTRCGIMDQYISAAGEPDHALLIDCRDLSYTPISIGNVDASWVVIDTKVKHSLASSAYNKRREECEDAVAAIALAYPGVRVLRDVDLQMLEESKPKLDEVIFRRARHVITENQRTLEAAQALSEGDASLMGRLMLASHESLRDDYEVTSPELNFLVEQACKIASCYGSRMTGGGFGGCTISLVQRAEKSAFLDVLSRRYEAEFGFAPAPLPIKSSAGAHEITV